MASHGADLDELDPDLGPLDDDDEEEDGLGSYMSPDSADDHYLAGEGTGGEASIDAERRQQATWKVDHSLGDFRLKREDQTPRPGPRGRPSITSRHLLTHTSHIQPDGSSGRPAAQTSTPHRHSSFCSSPTHSTTAARRPDPGRLGRMTATTRCSSSTTSA